ncbi:MAG TPA: AraC family transcriptional regulator [Planctomycetota bacterium]|nr:AraC family transcriptional regulator [Planctomycetota bacterium]
MQAVFEKIAEPGQSFVVRRRCDPAFDFRWHFHPEYELTYIVASRGQRFVGDSIEDYRDGDLVLLGPNLPHTWMSQAAPRAKAKHVAIYAQFLDDFAGDEFLSRPELSSVARLLERAAQGLRFGPKTQRLAAPLMEELVHATGLRRMLKLLEVLDFLAQRSDVQPLASPHFAPALKRADEKRIDAVCSFIHENFAQPIEQPDAARRAHLSVSAFSRFFKKTMGRTFTSYVNGIRVGQACRLLIESDKSIAEIAFASGFENLSNFNRRFRQVKRLSPREYRRKFGA